MDKTTAWKRKGNQGDFNNLYVALAAMIIRAGGQVIIRRDELAQLDGAIGVRGRYEPNGDFTLWTYDVVDDVKRIAGINE